MTKKIRLLKFLFEPPPMGFPMPHSFFIPVGPAALLFAIEIIPFRFFFTAGPVKDPGSLGFALDEFALARLVTVEMPQADM